MELSAYRVVQESLTNVLKHASASTPGSPSTSATTSSAWRSPTTAMAPVTGASGNGLVGMRERIDLFGGDFTAGPMPRGFAVKARIPLQPA